MKETNKKAFTYIAVEIEKLAAIGKCARQLAATCKLNNVQIEDILPLIVSMAKKELTAQNS